MLRYSINLVLIRVITLYFGQDLTEDFEVDLQVELGLQVGIKLLEIHFVVDCLFDRQKFLVFVLVDQMYWVELEVFDLNFQKMVIVLFVQVLGGLFVLLERIQHFAQILLLFVVEKVGFVVD